MTEPVERPDAPAEFLGGMATVVDAALDQDAYVRWRATRDEDCQHTSLDSSRMVRARGGLR
ncbi:MAG: hypothetical protein ACRDTT_03050 [Pseudonocardiaceae bacterium]